MNPRYIVDGVRLPSVTEVLRICGASDYYSVSGAVLLAAAARGKEAHEVCDLIDKGLLDPSGPFDESIAGYVEAYLKFKKDAGAEVLGSEMFCHSKRYRYVGTADKLMLCSKLHEKSEPITVDVKCVALVQPATRLQVAGYAFASEMRRRACLLLKNDGEYKFEEYSDPNDIFTFLSFVRVAHWKLDHGLAELEERL